MHANAYETLARQMFLVDVPLRTVVACTFLFAQGRRPGVRARHRDGSRTSDPADARRARKGPGHRVRALRGLAVDARDTPAVVLATAAAAAWRHLLVRRELVRAENEKIRYQHTMQFVTHEMRTPLTAIQGSSELIGRYGSMPEAKRKQMADLINAESKRLARMIVDFPQPRTPVGKRWKSSRNVLRCMTWSKAAPTRARPLAENKQIEIAMRNLPAANSMGDRELMEYAVYNLLTNAVKILAAPDARHGFRRRG